MNYFVLENYNDLSRLAAEVVTDQLKVKKDLLLGAATGNTPTGLYAQLAEQARRSTELFSAMRIIKLDEWLGLPMDHPGSCESYIRANLTEPLRTSAGRYLSFESNPDDPQAECGLIQSTLDKHGPIDICVLGIGTNGHICFNEPASVLTPHAHVAALAPSSQTHSMVAGSGMQLNTGLTIGMIDIFNARKILLLISGASKRDVVQRLLSKEITTDLPASLLWLHPHAICLIDRAAYE